MTSFSYQDLIACGEGKLFSDGGPPLPAPPMLMFDKITRINSQKGEFNKGPSIMDAYNNLRSIEQLFKLQNN